MAIIRLKTMENGIAKKMAMLDLDVVNGTKEKLVHSLYHIKRIVGASDGSVSLPSELNYFSIKTGANDDDGRPTTYADINMDSAGMISQGYYFWGQNIRAVSYTHLRAHETRHDLVCRLLLEKKKNRAKATSK